MAARHLPMVISHTASVAAPEAPAGYVMAWSMHFHLELGGGLGSRRLCQGGVNV